MTASLIAIGYCGWDHLCVLPKIPIDDKVKILQRIEQGGGPSATAVFAAAKLGIDTAFCSTVGDDPQADLIISSLQKAGVNTNGILKRPNSSSPTAYCWVDKDSGMRSIAWSHGDAVPLTPQELPKNLIRNADAIHLDGHQGNAALAAAQIARANAVHVSIDAGTMVQNIDAILELSDIIIASEKFARAYTHKDDPREAAKALFEIGDSLYTGVTLGPLGSVGFDGEQEYTQDSFKIDVKDTTGAGDTYHGAFLASFLKGYPFQECMRRASAASALKCTKLGGRTGIPDENQLNNFLKTH